MPHGADTDWVKRMDKFISAREKAGLPPGDVVDPENLEGFAHEIEGRVFYQYAPDDELREVVRDLSGRRAQPEPWKPSLRPLAGPLKPLTPISFMRSSLDGGEWYRPLRRR